MSRRTGTFQGQLFHRAEPPAPLRPNGSPAACTARGATALTGGSFIIVSRLVAHVLRLRRPIRHFPWSLGFRPGSPLSYCPLPFAFLGKLPVFRIEDSSSMIEVACCWLPRPRSAASQSAYRGGQVDLYGHDNKPPCAGPYSCVAPTISGLTGWHLRQGMPGAPFPVGLCTLQVIHHVISQPSTTSWRLVSSSWCLSGACCSRHRVVHNA